ncbi:MAG: single-stranded DNA-binding protein [Bacilli bacterium]|jgi:single-strand DNA-binding protein|nr:single-stranded DNA-binding protein [Bacilli bacterium]
MNRVMLVGRLTIKPELRYTGSNLPYSRFSVAVNRTFTNSQGQREADFINVVVWRKQAENVCNFLDKGSLVSVEGRLQTSSYEVNGEKRYRVEVVADSVQFLESKGTRSQGNYQGGNDNVSPYDYQSNNNSTTNDISVENDPFADFGESVTIDDDFLD